MEMCYVSCHGIIDYDVFLIPVSVFHVLSADLLSISVDLL